MRETTTADVLVLGAGGAGIAAATAAAEAGAQVLVVAKDPVGVGDTRISTGLIATARLAPGDSPAAFADDLDRSGAGLARPYLVSALAGAADDALRWLVDAGLRPDRDPAGDPTRIGPMGGHTAARSVPSAHRGVALAAALVDRFERAGVPILEEAVAVELLVADGRVCGALALHLPSGAWHELRAGAVILATGGCTHLFHPHADTMRSNTGDGLVLALRAGATLVDLEQVQFTPFGLVRPPSKVGLPLGESILAGPRGRLLDAQGELIADAVSHRSRAEVAGLIAGAVAAGRGTAAGGVFLDLAPNLRGRDGEAWLAGYRRTQRHVLRAVRRALGADAAALRTPWEVAPTAHYHMGGVAADADGWTGVPGLYVAGQALGGLHGANRLGSTSIPAVVAFGRRAGAVAAAASTPPGRTADAAALAQAAVSRRTNQPVLAATRALQAAAWSGLGPARTAQGIDSAREAAVAAARLDRGRAVAPHRWDAAMLRSIEHATLARVAELLALSAAARPHTLGAHLRIDAPAGPQAVRAIAIEATDGVAVARELDVTSPPTRRRATAPAPSPPGSDRISGTPVRTGGVRLTVETSRGPIEVRVAAGSTVLDALEQAACSQAPALAYRFGCRDGRCGLCTIELDGRPRLACRQRAREGAHIGPLQSLPTIADLVVDRAATDAQLRGLLPPAAPVDPVTPSPTWRSLEGCITCLACLDGCPVHAEGGGNPLAFLRLERARTQPGATDAIARQSVAAAAALGLERCATCMGCRCGVGIPLVSAAIAPLLRATQHAASDHER